MAKTAGHGNPKWHRDETILALELYFECKGELPSDTDSRVIALSELLQKLTLHPPSKRKASFRNPAGVSFKLQNIRQVATGQGLDHTSATDRAVWDELGSRPQEVAKLAKVIRQTLQK